MATPNDRRYTSEHEWVLREGDLVVVGITHHAQDSLGDIVFLELPEVGRTLQQSEPLGVVESVKAVSDIYAPVSGEVIEINEAIISAPETVNQDPYGDGWMIKVRMTAPDEYDGLMSAEEYDRQTSDGH